MEELSPFAMTFIQYVREFTNDIEVMPELTSEFIMLAPMVEEIALRGTCTMNEILQIENLLRRCDQKIMNLYARYSDSPFLGTMYSRISSLKSMALILHPEEQG